MPDCLDKAGPEYWEKMWSGRELPDPIDPSDRSLNNHLPRRMDRFLRRHLADEKSRDAQARARLLEVGCAGSPWLPYFATEFGYRLEGVDYSALGCDQARATLRKAGVEGEVHRADIFEPPELLLGRFDVVFSFGVLEHFSPTERALGQMAKFVRPSGKIITIIPNMTHAVGWLQKTVDRKVYDIHVPLDDRDLAAAHEACGLRLLEASYLGTVNWCVVNYANLSGRWWQPAIIRLAAWASKVVWLGESAGVPEVPNRWTSPYIGAVAEVA